MNLTFDTDTSTVAGMVGNVNTGFRVGNTSIVFHPGFAGGALRIDGGVIDNTRMGFTPNNDVYMQVTILLKASGEISISIVNGAQHFEYEWLNHDYIAGITTLGLAVAASAAKSGPEVATTKKHLALPQSA